MERKKLIVAGLISLVVIISVSVYLQSNTVQEKVEVKQDIPVVTEVESSPALEEVTYVVSASDYLEEADFVKVSDTGVLTSAEKAGLIMMREEEKLARDVYSVLADEWGVRIFSNIAASEQTHMNVMGALLSKYSLPDPIKDDTVGVFTDSHLQDLYNDLTKRGLTSRAEAFQVGATIEDLDIYDLEELLAKTDKVDIIQAYQNLQKGSRNHLRAFTRQIERSGDGYKPQYISISEYQSIISSAQEQGRI